MLTANNIKNIILAPNIFSGVRKTQRRNRTDGPFLKNVHENE